MRVATLQIKHEGGAEARVVDVDDANELLALAADAANNSERIVFSVVGSLTYQTAMGTDTVTVVCKRN